MLGTVMQANAATAVEPAVQVLMVGLGGEIIALAADIVREILDPVPTTRVAGARDFVPALINVRGNVIPLANLHARFGMPKRAQSADTRIVVIEVKLGDDPVVVGVLADKVYEVVELAANTSQPTPRLGMSWKPEFIRSIAKWNDEFVIIPEIEAILS